MTPHPLNRFWLITALVLGILLATLLGASGGAATSHITAKTLPPGTTFIP